MCIYPLHHDFQKHHFWEIEVRQKDKHTNNIHNQCKFSYHAKQSHQHGYRNNLPDKLVHKVHQHNAYKPQKQHFLCLLVLHLIQLLYGDSRPQANDELLCKLHRTHGIQYND